MTNTPNDKYKIIRYSFLIIAIVAAVGKVLFLNDEKSVLSFSIGVLFIIVAILSCCIFKFKMKETNKIEKFNVIMETILIFFILV